MYRNGANNNNNRNDRPPTGSYYQQSAQQAAPNYAPASPPPPNHGFQKYGYDGSAAWSNYPPSPHAPPPPNYSPQHAPLSSQLGRQQQPPQPQPQPQTQPNSFYNTQWDNSPQRPPQPVGYQQNGMHPQLSPSGFYNPNAHRPQPAQPPQQQQQQYNYQPQIPQQQQQQQPYIPNLQNAVPLMMAAGMQMAAGNTGGANNVAQIGAQMFTQMAPNAANMAQQILSSGAGRDSVNTFMKLPKYYFMVNHGYVRKKLLLLLKPWGNPTWRRQRAVNPTAYARGEDAYSAPKDDTNAPDLYIPLMSFATYVLLAGIILGGQGRFKSGTLAQYLSKGAGVLTLEAVVIKLGLYLINAKPTPWLDVIAYRGYKFVGVGITMAATLLHAKLYWPLLLYTSSMMGIFLMKSHRNIVLPREAVNNPAELARRNTFLFFLCVLQYPIYWVLVIY